MLGKKLHQQHVTQGSPAEWRQRGLTKESRRECAQCHQGLGASYVTDVMPALHASFHWYDPQLKVILLLFKSALVGLQQQFSTHFSPPWHRGVVLLTSLLWKVQISSFVYSDTSLVVSSEQCVLHSSPSQYPILSLALKQISPSLPPFAIQKIIYIPFLQPP